MMKWPLLAGFLLLIGASSTYANDGAAEASAGGLKLRKERSVLMEKEHLFITQQLVRVEYDFRNTSKEPVSSDVAFPIPPFGYEFERPSRDFSDFKAWVNGNAIDVEKEVRAFVGDHEITVSLRRARITIENFGNYAVDSDNKQYEIMNLRPEVRDKLARMGALGPYSDSPYNAEEVRTNLSYRYAPKWKVQLTYHWHQKFAPGEIVHIKHEYMPVVGLHPFPPDELLKELRIEACMDTVTIDWIKQRVTNKLIYTTWVNYILTTANTWQTPIQDFELEVLAQDRKGYQKTNLVAFCWDGPVEKVRSNTHIRARKTNFVPTKELRVYFLPGLN